MRDLTYEFGANFQGMTTEPVELEALLVARDQMIVALHQGLDEDERAFLLSLAAGEPDGIGWVWSTLARCRQFNGSSRTWPS